MFNRGKDLRVPKFWNTELRTAEPLVCTMWPWPKFWDTELRLAGTLGKHTGDLSKHTGDHNERTPCTA